MSIGMFESIRIRRSLLCRVHSAFFKKYVVKGEGIAERKEIGVSNELDKIKTIRKDEKRQDE